MYPAVESDLRLERVCRGQPQERFASRGAFRPSEADSRPGTNLLPLAGLTQWARVRAQREPDRRHCG
jgi:hypothetical protein